MMKFERLFPFIKSSELLVCETDGFFLSGAVVVSSGAHVDILHQAKVKQVDMEEALDDLIDDLKNDGWQGGGNAILLSQAVLSTLVELPVNPKKPRPLAQMIALVQGEVEVLLMQYMTRWSVGNLLVGRGYMNEEQAETVMDLQQGKPNPAGGLALSDQFSFRRFGELAEELGYIKRSELNACLTGQEWLKADDDEIECNWVAQGEIDDIPGSYQWLVSCIVSSILERWSALFAKHGVSLKEIYPYSGCASGLMPKSLQSELILEVHDGMVSASRLEDGLISRRHDYLNVNKSALALCLESYHAMQYASKECIWLACQQQEQGRRLSDELQNTLAVEVKVLDDPAINARISPGMIGAARHYFRIVESRYCVGLRNGGPLPPLFERLEVRAAILLVSLLLIMAAVETSLWFRHSTAQSINRELEARWNSIDGASKLISERNKQIKLRKQAWEKQQVERKRLQALLTFYNREIPERTALVKAVLGVLRQSVNEEIIINRIYEEKEKSPQMPVPPNSVKAKDKRVEIESFTLDAWALSEAAAQNFIHRIQQAVEPWQLELRDTRVLSAAGPMSLQGFAVTMRMVKLLPLAQLQKQGSR